MAIISDVSWSTRSLNADNNLYAFASTGPGWSNFLRNYGVRDQGAYHYDIKFTDHGKQKFRTSADDDAWLYIDGVFVGKFGVYTLYADITTPKIYEKDTVHRISIIRNNTQAGSSGAAAQWIGREYSPVNISSFSASPNPQTSGSIGNPSSTVQLLWSVQNASEIEIDNNIGVVTPSSGSKEVDTLLQSDAASGTTSPARKKYKLTATGNSPSDIQTQEITVFVYNDNVPNNFEVPNALGLEPNTQYEIQIGSITGIDMVTVARSSTGVQLEKNNNGAFTRTIFISNNDTLRAKFFSPAFNTDPRALPNEVQYYVEVGPIRKYFTVQTRAPREDELYNFANNPSEVPFPTPPGNDEGGEEYLVSPTRLTINETELTNPYGVEIKTTLNDTTEVRVKKLGEGFWSNWENTNPMFQTVEDFPSQTPIQIDNMDWTPITQRSGSTVEDNTPNLISTRSAGNLTARNIQET